MQIALKIAERETVSLSVLFRSSDQNRTVPLEGTYKDQQIQLPNHFRDKQKLKLIIDAQHLLNRDKHGASTTSVGRCSTTFTTEAFFLISILTFPWHSIVLLLPVLSSVAKEETSTSSCASPPQEVAERNLRINRSFKVKGSLKYLSN